MVFGWIGHIHYSFLCYDRNDEIKEREEKKTKSADYRTSGGVDGNNNDIGNGTYTILTILFA